MSVDPGLVDATFARLRGQLAALLAQLETLAAGAGSVDVLPIIADLRATIAKPFLFVVVGEIKAGKSSFVNALLGEDICRVDPAPCTDVIQEIVFAPTTQNARIGPETQRIGLPVDILRDIAIVDTPGTNTIITRHQAITQNYIPNSGLVIFVFPAKNPHTRSAWELLETISDQWRKNIVFVLQQADLATDRELAVNIAKVAEYAVQRGIADPVIFPTSAIREAAGQADSGFDPIRRFIRGQVTGGRHLHLKLRAILNTSESLYEKIAAELAAAQHQLHADRQVNAQMAEQAAARHSGSREKARSLVAEIVKGYEDCAGRLKQAFEAGLSVPLFFRRSFGAVLGRKQGLKQWLAGLQDEFTRDLSQSLDGMLQRGESAIMADIEAFVRHLALSLAQVASAYPRPDDPTIDFWQHRKNAIDAIQGNISALLPKVMVPEHLASMPEQAGSTVVGGSAMTLIGTLLLATTHITLLDVTGGILAGLGLVLTGSVVWAKRSQMVKELAMNLDSAQQDLSRELERGLMGQIDALYALIAGQLKPLDQYVTERQTVLAGLDEKGRSLGQGFAELAAAVDNAGAMTAA